jgi:hypothetical protein
MGRTYSLDGVKMKACRLLGRRRHRRVNNIKIDLNEIGWDNMDWIHLAQNSDRLMVLVNTLMNLRDP